VGRPEIVKGRVAFQHDASDLLVRHHDRWFATHDERA
jgi:hypothetical protein